MQNSEEDRQDEGFVKDIEQRLELSAAWRELLGLEASAPNRDAVNKPAAPDAPVLKNDPWAVLLRMQGVQVVDLQQMHMQSAQSALDEEDVELALNNIQEQEP